VQLDDLTYSIILFFILAFSFIGLLIMIFSKSSQRKEDGMIMLLVSLAIFVLYFNLVP